MTRRNCLRAGALVLTLPAATALLAACGGAVPTTQQAAPTAAVGTTSAASAVAAGGTRVASPASAAGTATRAAATASAGVSTAGSSPSSAPNVPDAYTKLPAQFKSVNAVPGKGSKVTAFLIGYNRPVPGRGSNNYWQELEKRLGATFEPTVTPGPDGAPTRTDLGSVEIGDLPTVLTNPPAFDYPDSPDVGPYLQGVTQDLLALGVDGPVIGLFSPTAAAKTGEQRQFNRDNLTSLVAGRDPLSAYDSWVQGWRSRGGEQIRKESQAALAMSR